MIDADRLRIAQKALYAIASGVANRSRNKSYGGFKPGRLTRGEMMDIAKAAIHPKPTQNRTNTRTVHTNEL